MLEIILLFFGLRAVITGTFNVGGGEATGLGARIAGFILILPVPLTILIVAGGMEGNETEDFFSYYWNNGIFWVELGLIAGCSLVGYTVASVSAFSRRYGDGEIRYRTEARDDIYLPPSIGQSLPSVKKGRRPPRSRKGLDIPEFLKEVDELEEVEEAEPRARRRKPPLRREYEDQDDYDEDYEDEEDDWRPRRHSRRVLWTILAASLGLVLLGGLVLIVVLNRSSLKRYEFGEPGKTFRVRMPKGASKDATERSRVRTVEVKESNGLHYLLKVRQVEAQAGLDARESLLDSLRTVYANDGLNVTEETRTLWDSNSPGRLLGGNVAGSTKRFRARLWLVEGRLFFLIVRGPVDRINSADATSFLDSLELPYHPRSR